MGHRRNLVANQKLKTENEAEIWAFVGARWWKVSSKKEVEDAFVNGLVNGDDNEGKNGDEDGDVQDGTLMWYNYDFLLFSVFQ